MNRKQRIHKKQEKRIVKLLYRKGLFDLPLADLYWEEYKFASERYYKWHYTVNGETRTTRYRRYFSEVHFATVDYWGECDEHGLVSWVNRDIYWTDAVIDEHYHPTIGKQKAKILKNRNLFIKYLQTLPTIRHDAKINRVLVAKIDY